MAKNKQGDGDPVIVKKYANRRLYNTSSSSYITLDDLAKMVREDVEFQVLDAKTGDSEFDSALPWPFHGNCKTQRTDFVNTSRYWNRSSAEMSGAKNFHRWYF